MKIYNLTPHKITLINEFGSTEFPPIGVVPRLEVSKSDVGTMFGVPLVRATFGEVIDLPDEQDGVMYLVSALVREFAKERKDLLSPGDQVRNEQGQVIGCKSLFVN